MTNRVAIILGGAQDWQRDLEATARLLWPTGVRSKFSARPKYFAVNDQIAFFSGDIVACTLHPERIREWIDARAEQNLPPPREIWTRHENGLIQMIQAERPSTEIKTLKEWGGTSGLFAFQVARQYGHEKIIFCGVPMIEAQNAFHDIGCAIAKYTRHRDVWKRNMPAIAPFARSCSGWTAEKLGKPDEQWLGEQNVSTNTFAV